MKKRVLSIIALMCCVLETFCMPVGATNSEQDEPEIIATEEFVVYMTDQSRSVSETTAVYPVNVRTNFVIYESLIGEENVLHKISITFVFDC